MRKPKEKGAMLKAAIVLGVFMTPAVGFSHTPVDVPYATRGKCEAQMEKDNILHSLEKVAAGEYANMGEAMKAMHEHFWCERIGDYWYMLRTPFPSTL